MKIQHYKEATAMNAAPGVTMYIAAGVDEGAPTFVTRLFEIQPGSSTPHHTHPWEHEMFVVSGKGTLLSGEKQTPLKEGDAAMILPDEKHSILNTGTELLKVICVVPIIDGVMPGMPKPAL